MTYQQALDASATLLPTLFNTPLFHLDTIANHKPREWQEDTNFFKNNPNRKQYVRGSFDGEFYRDEMLPLRYMQRQPQHQSLVIQLAPGIHLCLFVYMGRKLLNTEAKTDSDVAQLLLEMEKQQGGWDGPEMREYLAAVKEAINAEAKRIANRSTNSKDETVN
jgi:hypothetical protein